MLDWRVEERRLDARAAATGDAIGWFEELYAAGAAGRVTMPWNRSEPHVLLAEWTQAQRPDGAGRRAIVVGCGLGADAEHVAGLGFDMDNTIRLHVADDDATGQPTDRPHVREAS